MKVVVLCISYCIFVHSAPLLNVAFIFAGSPRSFLSPPIHLSIKHNLIEAFCPANICNPQIFARLSFSDNSHDGIRYSSQGLQIPRQSEKIEPTLELLRGLCKLVTYEIVDIGSPEEQTGMDRIITANITKHKLYRDLDPRRYSMYFNRWSAYQMAVRQEQSSGVKFDWIVHARLDFFFGEPVRPVSLWNPNKLWVVDQWMYDVPDVFALLPRKYSDLFFSLDDMFVDPRVSCLGGPDFHFATASRESLSKLGYDEAMMSLVQKELCHKKIPVPGSLVTDKATNTQWTVEGISEVWLRRKLTVNKVTLKDKTLGYSTFFAVLVRDPLQFVCANTKPTSFIGWLRDKYYAPLAMSVGCFSIDDDFRLLRGMHGDTMNKRFGPNCDMQTLTSKSKSMQVDTPQSGCLLDSAVTNWNFMPFQIKSDEDLCMTTFETKRLPMSSKASGSTGAATVTRIPVIQRCNASSEYVRIKSYYTQSQLFSFYPSVSSPQRITQFDIASMQRLCLTVTESTNPNAGGFAIGKELMRIVLVKCESSVVVSQLFRIRIVGLNPAMEYGDSSQEVSHEMHMKIDGTVHYAQQATTNVVTSSLMNYNSNSRHAFDEKSLVVFRWIGKNEQYCLAFRNGATVRTQPSSPEASSWGNRAGKVVLQYCNDSMIGESLLRSNRRAKLTYFRVERTRNKASTTTVGKF